MTVIILPARPWEHKPLLKNNAPWAHVDVFQAYLLPPFNILFLKKNVTHYWITLAMMYYVRAHAMRHSEMDWRSWKQRLDVTIKEEETSIRHDWTSLRNWWKIKSLELHKNAAHKVFEGCFPPFFHLDFLHKASAPCFTWPLPEAT